MASGTWGSLPSHIMIIPNTKRHPTNTKRIDFPVAEVTVSVHEKIGKLVFIDREN